MRPVSSPSKVDSRSRAHDASTVLLTGASGLLGRAAAVELIGRGHAVVGTTRKQAERLPVDCSPAHLDVRDADSVRELVARCEVVVHLAALVGNDPCERDPHGAVEVNVRGTLNVLEACRDLGRPMIFGSVANVDDDGPYAITKATAERFCLMHARELGTRVLPLRIYNTYGPGQLETSGKLVASNVARAARGEALICHDGTQTEDFVFVDDVAFGIAEACDRLLHDADFPLAPREIGTGVGTTILQVLETIREVGGGRSAIETRERRAGSRSRRLVAAETPFRPPRGFVSLEDGIRRMFASLAAPPDAGDAPTPSGARMERSS